jgi:hypothetical protein
MILTEAEVQNALEKSKVAFPNLSDWEYQNEANTEYFGFTLWGQFTLTPADPMSQHYFITLGTYKEEWNGYLTIGQHSYLWSSADVGDAHLLGTDPCNSIEETIKELKTEILKLFRAFSVIQSIEN